MRSTKRTYREKTVTASYGRGTGLLCRADQGCREVFHPVRDTVRSILEAGKWRTMHEWAVHDYAHVRGSDHRPNFAQPNFATNRRHAF